MMDNLLFEFYLTYYIELHKKSVTPLSPERWSKV